MIDKIGQVMVYVQNQEEAVKFWTEQVGFVLKEERNDGNGMVWYEVAPSEDAETSIILHNKELIAQMQPELNLGTPSLLLFSKDVERMRDTLQSNGVTVGDLVEMPTGKVFNFADDEGNYFAVIEK